MSTKDAIKLAAFLVSKAVGEANNRRGLANPRYISDELHHMVGYRHPGDDERNYALLKQILNSGWISCDPPRVGSIPTQCTTNFGGRLVDESFVKAKITCYCDIPLEALALHIVKYGCFGISFSRWRMAQHAARPVNYIPMRDDDWAGAHTGRTVLGQLEASYRGLVEQLCEDRGPIRRGIGLTAVPTTPAEAAEKLDGALALQVLAFIKPFNSHLSERDPQYFYSEREWRMLGSMEANPSTVSHVIVKRGFLRRARREIPAFADRIVFAPKQGRLTRSKA